MSEKESAKDVIDKYRKRQAKAWQTTLLFIGIALLIILGAAFLVFWLTGAKFDPRSLFATKTPTPTQTFTPTPVPPTATETLTPTEAPPTDTPSPSLTPTRSGAVLYIVQEGDSLYSIAEKFDVDLFTLVVRNREREDFDLDPVNPSIYVGDEILIPAPSDFIPTPTSVINAPRGMPVEYTVRPGDSVELIARKLNSTVEDILRRNEFIEEEQDGVIYTGQVLTVRVNLVTPVPTQEPQDTPQKTPGSISTLTATPEE